MPNFDDEELTKRTPLHAIVAMLVLKFNGGKGVIFTHDDFLEFCKHQVEISLQGECIHIDVVNADDQKH